MEESLRRALSTPEVLFLGINGVVGAGIFLLPGTVAKDAGNHAVWAYLVAGAIIILIGLAFAEASSMVSNTGGPYVYTSKAMGRTVGFTVGWMSWVTFVTGWAALSVGLAGYLIVLIPSLAPFKAVIILGIIGLLCLLNSLGIRRGSGAVAFFTVAKLLPLALLILYGLFSLSTSTSHPYMGGTPTHFGQAVLVLIFAYGGFEMASIPAGEMTNPKRSAAIGVVGTLVGTTIFYALIQWATQRLDPSLASSATPVGAAGAMMFAGGAIVMTIGATISILGTQSGVALSAPRVLYALSLGDGLPPVFSKVWRRFQTPVVAIWVTGVLASLLALTGTFTHLILLNVAARLYEYGMVCIAVIILRLRDPKSTRAFRLPLGITIPLVAAILCLALLTRESGQQIVAAAAALVIGVLIFAIDKVTRRRPDTQNMANQK